MRRVPRLVSSSAWVYLRIRADHETGVDSLPFPTFDLSHLKVLRSLEVGDWTVDFRPARHTAVMEVFSTITSPVFSELVIIIGAKAVTYLPSDVLLFETLRTMNKIRPFKLVFLLADPDLFWGSVRRKLRRALDCATTGGHLDFLDSPPTIRSTRFPEHGWNVPFD